MARIWTSAAPSMLFLAALATLPAPAAAATAIVQWSTYLRTGPGAAFTSVDELQHGAPVSLGACAGNWCKVSDGSAVGYVDKDSLQLPATPTGAAAGLQSCFESAQKSYKGPWETRFCAAESTARTPAVK